MQTNLNSNSNLPQNSENRKWQLFSPLYPNYMVSNTGEVLNTKRNALMKLEVNGGYHYVKLYNKYAMPKRKGFRVNRMVATAFLKDEMITLSITTGIASCDLKVDHMDDDRLNNYASNLRWLTNKENVEKTLANRRNPASGFPFKLLHKPTNNTHIVMYGEMLLFCKEHGLRYNAIKELRRGDIDHYKGFVFVPSDKKEG